MFLCQIFHFYSNCSDSITSIHNERTTPKLYSNVLVLADNVIDHFQSSLHHFLCSNLENVADDETVSLSLGLLTALMSGASDVKVSLPLSFQAMSAVYLSTLYFGMLLGSCLFPLPKIAQDKSRRILKTSSRLLNNS